MSPKFKPFHWLRNPYLQTILGSKWQPPKPLLGEQHTIILPDNDRLIATINPPNTPRVDQPTLIIFHGLLGHDNSPYVLRAAYTMLKQGWQVVRANFRGCGPGTGRAKGLCHSGRSEDVAATIAYIQRLFPNSPIAALGFSQGGNILLKYAAQHINQLTRTIAICPPIDLAASADRFELKRNNILKQYFMRKLKTYISERHTTYPELGDAPPLDKRDGFWAFDQCYTAKHAGFTDVHDYYRQSSAYHDLEYIAGQTSILFAEDDPIIESQHIMKMALPDNIQRHSTTHGGHMGYYHIGRGNTGWLEHYITNQLSHN